jgi:hypothetical protein
LFLPKKGSTQLILLLTKKHVFQNARNSNSAVGEMLCFSPKEGSTQLILLIYKNMTMPATAIAVGKMLCFSPKKDQRS